MKQIGIIIPIISTLIFTACAPTQGAETAPKPGSQNQPHLPPPDFPVSESPSANDRICSGMVARGSLASCAASEFCYIPIGQHCGAADYPGVCRTKPEICTQEYAPVCGCDGKTYSNECLANGAGVSANYRGECKS